jgi:hypothetical protein
MCLESTPNKNAWKEFEIKVEPRKIRTRFGKKKNPLYHVLATKLDVTVDFQINAASLLLYESGVTTPLVIGLPQEVVQWFMEYEYEVSQDTNISFKLKLPPSYFR